MTATYTRIATSTLGSAASTVTLSSFASTYTDLVLIAQVKTTTYNGVDINVQLNNDTAGNYSTTAVRGNGSSASSARTTSATYFSIDSLSIMNTTNWSITRLNLQNYSNTTTYKTILARSDRAGSGTSATVNLWRNTAAITSIKFSCGADQYAAGSTFTLYGIEAA